MKRLFQYSTCQLLFAAGFATVLARSLFPTVSQTVATILNEIPWDL